MARTQAEEEPFEIDGIEYRPYSQSRSEVQTFNVGDRIGNGKYLITKSEADPNNVSMWMATWVNENGPFEFHGVKEAKDWRWVQSTYVIQETP